MSKYKRIWSCKIGEHEFNNKGADMPMQAAVAEAYEVVTGHEPTFIFSGWGAELMETERAVVEDRAPLSVMMPEEWEAVARFLWGLLDDIDTLDDACKSDDGAFRNQTRRAQQKRWKVGDSDGHNVAFKPAPPKAIQGEGS